MAQDQPDEETAVQVIVPTDVFAAAHDYLKAMEDPEDALAVANNLVGLLLARLVGHHEERTPYRVR